MKLINYMGVLFLMSITSAFISQGNPCGSEAFLEACAPALGEYTFIKTFDIAPKMGEKQEISYIMSKGSKYRIVVCDQDIKGYEMKVKLKDRNQKLIASNYLSEERKYFQTLNYTCPATGVYYIESSFKSNKEGCGVIILGFTK